MTNNPRTGKKSMTIEPDNIKDHDLLVRLDEKVDNIGRVLEALNKSLDARGQAIDDLKSYKLLHETETSRQNELLSTMDKRVTALESTLEIHEKTHDARIATLEQTSILMWTQKHPKATLIILGTLVIMINFHDVITPFLLSLLGLKVPGTP